MTKQKKQNNKPKKQKKGSSVVREKRVGEVRNNNIGKSSSMSLTMGICSISNPFCPEAIQARWPDNSNTKSVGWSMSGLPKAITADAAGSASIMLFGIPQYNSMVATTVVGDVITWPATCSSLFTVPANVSRWRTTSWGFRVTCSAAPLTLTGNLRIRMFSPQNCLGLGTTSLTSMSCDSSYDVPLHRILDKDVFVLPMPLGTNARLFNEQATANTLLGTNPSGWQIAQISVQGAPINAVAFNIHSYYNFEFVFDDGDASMAFGAPPPLDNPLLRAGTSVVMTKMNNYVEGTLATVERLAIGAASKFASTAMRAMGPGGAMAGQGLLMLLDG